MNPWLERVALRSRARVVTYQRRHRGNPKTVRTMVLGWAGTSRARLLVAVPAVVVLLAVAGVWWLVSQLAGFGAILAGWSPPLTLANLDTAPATPQPDRLRTVPTMTADDQVVEDDPAAWNFNNDPWAQLQREQLALQREQLSELRLQREARQAELAAPRSEHRPAPAAPPLVPTQWRPATGVATRRPLPVVRALVLTAVVAGLAWGIGAFALGVASQAGWVRQPPTFAELEHPETQP